MVGFSGKLGQCLVLGRCILDYKRDNMGIWTMRINFDWYWTAWKDWRHYEHGKSLYSTYYVILGPLMIMLDTDTSHVPKYDEEK